MDQTRAVLGDNPTRRAWTFAPTLFSVVSAV